MIEFWLKDYPDRVPVRDEASLAEARKLVREVGAEAQFSGEMIESMAVVATELARNQVRHAGGGRMVCQAFDRAGRKGLEVLAADNGPGIGNPGDYLEEGQPGDDLSGSMREGIGTVLRMADEVNFDIRHGEGSLVHAIKYQSPAKAFGFEYALLGLPHPEERISGDSGLFMDTDGKFLAALVDGVGHGQEARKAANQTLAFVRSKPEEPFESLIPACDRAIWGSRGASLVLARYDKDRRAIAVAGAGDINGLLVNLKAETKHFTTVPRSLGLVSPGENHWQVLVENKDVAAGCMLILHSDGIRTHWRLDDQQAMFRKHPLALAQFLIDHYQRGTDDATVMVVRFANRPS